jgi:peptidoglycan/xylan/chitin deacetylase (PgdA/CDA1 family)
MSKKQLVWSTIVIVLACCVALALTPAGAQSSQSTATPSLTPPRKPTLTVTATREPLRIGAPSPTATTTVLATAAPSPTPATLYPTPTPDDRAGPTPDGQARNVRVPILMYHYVSEPPEDADNYRVGLSVTPDMFRQQMQYMKDNGYQAITLDDLMYALVQGAPLPPKPVVLTFDDGYADMYDNAFPILQEFGFTGTFFVVTAWIDEENPNYLAWEQAREMAEAGMRIESHSKTHPDLTDKPYDFILYEVLGSIESVEAHVGYRPRFFCYPGGAFDDYLVSTLPDFGIWGAVTTEAGTRHYTDRPLLLRRVRVEYETDLTQFAAFLEWGREGD